MPLTIICSIVHPAGVNALYVVPLWMNRNAVLVGKDPSIDEKQKQKAIGGGTMVSFLHHPYSDQYFWWEAVDSVCAADVKHNLVCRQCDHLCVPRLDLLLPLRKTRRILLVGISALVEVPGARLVAALSISTAFLVVQNEHKPYATAEHNFLASLAASQITTTLLFIVMEMVISVPRVFGLFCIFLNFVLLPLVISFNARRLKRRKDLFTALFMVEREVDEKTTKEQRPILKRKNAVWGEFFTQLTSTN